jgi:hypothetical protein
MGTHKNISAKKFPKQGPLLNKEVEVCFHYDTSEMVRGRCIRDDTEEPYLSIFSLTNGRVVLSTECQYSTVDGDGLF